MAAGGREASEVYAIIKEFTHTEWKEFARSRLKLGASDLEEIEYASPKDLKEQKYQAVLLWQRRNGRRNGSVENLRRLVSVYRNPEQPARSTNNNSSRPQPAADTREESMGRYSPAAQNTATVAGGQSGHANSAKAQAVYGAEGRANSAKTQAVYAEEQAISRTEPKAIADDGENSNLKSRSNGASKSAPQGGDKEESSEAAEGKTGSIIKQLTRSLKRSFSVTSPHNNLCDAVHKVKVVPATAREYKMHLKRSSDIYQITRRDKGYVLILNNTFTRTPGFSERFGSEKDVSHMEDLWRQFGCRLHKNAPQLNKSANEMKMLINEVATVEDAYDFVVIVVMTHGGVDSNGGEDIFYGEDGGEVAIKDVLERFHNTEATALYHTPKFFIFQCCRGDKVDSGVVTDSGDLRPKSNVPSSLEAMFQQMTEREPIVVADSAREVLPSVSDMLVAYATHDAHAALRNKANGSWFINAITNIFMKHAKDEHVTELLTRVNGAMKAKTGLQPAKDKHGRSVSIPMKAMSNHHSSLSKKLYLFPGFPAN